MTDLERRALLGDEQAQEECTRKGIVLPCPICKSRNIVKGFCQSFEYVQCTNCGLYIRICGVKRWVSVIARWNTRPAPPIGRCDQCQNWRGEPGDEYAPCSDCDGVMERNNYCRNYEPKEAANEK